MIDIKNQHGEDNLKSVTFRERATTVKKMIKLGYKLVLQNKSDEHTIIEHWQHVVNAGSFSTKGVPKHFDMTKVKWIKNDVTTQQIVL